jgi:hypothetical protein
MTTDYTLDVQKLFLQILLSVPELYVRVGNIFNPQNFDKSLREPAEFLQEYVNQYTVIPEVTVFNSVLSTDFTIISDLNDKNQKWFLDEFEGFLSMKSGHVDIVEDDDSLRNSISDAGAALDYRKGDLGSQVRDLTDGDMVVVVIEARHHCVASRGARQPEANTVTMKALGVFSEPAARAEIMALIAK